MERLLKDMAECLLEVGTCSGHVCMERFLIEVTDFLLELEHAQVMYVWRGFPMT